MDKKISMKKLIILMMLFTLSLSYAQIVITEKFTNNIYDSTNWNRSNGCYYFPLSFVDDKIKKDAHFLSDYTCYYWYSNRFISVKSSTNNNIDFSARFWKNQSSASGDGTGIAIAPYNNITNYAVIKTTSDTIITTQIYTNGVQSYTNNIALSVLDSNRVYRINYDKINKQIKFYYKPDTISTIWTQMGITQSYDFYDSLLVASTYSTANNSTVYHFLDDFSLTYIPYNAPIPDNLVFHQPDDYDSFNKGDTIQINWYATKDSIRLFIRGDTVNVYNDTTYSFIITDTTNFSFQINGEIINPVTYNGLVWGTTYKDSIMGLQYIGLSKFIEIDTVYQNNDTITMTTFTKGIDSLRYYTSTDTIHWTFVGQSSIISTTGIDTTIFNFSISSYPELFGKLFYKAEEYRNAIIHLDSIDYYQTSLAAYHDKRICYYSESLINGIKNSWEFDPSCGWNAKVSYSLGRNVIIDDILDSVYIDPYHNNLASLSGYDSKIYLSRSAPCVIFCSGDTSYNSKNCLDDAFLMLKAMHPDLMPYYHWSSISVGAAFSNNNISIFDLPFSVIDSSCVFKNYRYRVVANESKVYIDDLINDSTYLYCNYSDAYKKYSSYTMPYFVSSKKVISAFSLYPFSPFHDSSYSTPDGQYCNGLPSDRVISTSAYGVIISSNIDSFFVPKLMIVDDGGFYNSIAIPLINHLPNDSSPLLYDIWSSEINVQNRRNYFRGIHPKIWKYGNINGVKQ
jgi:hypothetical protein